MLTTVDRGNNETLTAGIEAYPGGGFHAQAWTAGRSFKTEAGAATWLAKRGFYPDGRRLPGNSARATVGTWPRAGRNGLVPATIVRFADGRVVQFTERLPARLAIPQAAESLAREDARAAANEGRSR